MNTASRGIEKNLVFFPLSSSNSFSISPFPFLSPQVNNNKNNLIKYWCSWVFKYTNFSDLNSFRQVYKIFIFLLSTNVWYWLGWISSVYLPSLKYSFSQKKGDFEVVKRTAAGADWWADHDVVTRLKHGFPLNLLHYQNADFSLLQKYLAQPHYKYTLGHKTCYSTANATVADADYGFQGKERFQFCKCFPSWIIK